MMKMTNKILNELNMNDKKWNFTKALITKALEMNNCEIFAQDHTYIESAFEITEEVKQDAEKELSNIFDYNEKLSISYVFNTNDNTINLTIYTEIDFIYNITVYCDSNLNFDNQIRVFCDKTPNTNVAIATTIGDGNRKYYKNC